MKTLPLNFALLGAAGYIAPRHMEAIRATGNKLIAALDPSDSVGIIDSYFPDAHFFTEFERFDRHIEKMRRKDKSNSIDYVSICSPNYLHDAHIRFAFRSGATAICEKPLVLNPWNLDGLQDIEQATGRKAYNILQLRHHPTIMDLHQKHANSEKHLNIDLSYITSRGNWYLHSWKGDDSKSGGIATNIGVHFFDMLGWILGKHISTAVYLKTPTKVSGTTQFAKGTVRWFLSIDSNDLPKAARDKEQRTFRSIKIDNQELEFSGGFTDLHTTSYKEILAGNGYGLEDARQCIEIVYGIREAKISALSGDYHPYLKGSQ
ncbi:Gfo/Idh/MocA family oxidoreductase [Saccharophagus degradans]|uniref:Gfo/Idh/MocA family oxidoreductase n=1 Tax=Saccharophagus degradans TaxID=86304 RepID=UPI001C0921CC|nr:Gfo/Idh/MocA family oxidoreductase [Saccharophagus degradans]MBU2984499.1 Gfo/Idh/MocA family oxidoreductase [Saccharophagus degradans]